MIEKNRENVMVNTFVIFNDVFMIIEDNVKAEKQGEV
jgi:hypothetical protein